MRKLFKPVNRRLRWLVGLMLLGLFCIQCASPEGQQAMVTEKVAVALSTNMQSASADKFRQLAQRGHVYALQYCMENLQQKYRDYTCTFVKQERIGGTLTKEQEIAVKFRSCPFSVMMAWKTNAPQGDRVLYVEGLYGGNMLVRPANALARALAPTVQRKPDGPDAKRSALRTVDQFGFEKSLQNLIDVYVLAKERGHLQEQMGQDAQLDGRAVFTLIRHLPQNADYPAAKTISYIDQEYLLPVMIEAYGWKDEEFLCRYVFKNIQFTSLGDDDFLPESNDLVNPKASQ